MALSPRLDRESLSQQILVLGPQQMVNQQGGGHLLGVAWCGCQDLWFREGREATFMEHTFMAGSWAKQFMDASLLDPHISSARWDVLSSFHR